MLSDIQTCLQNAQRKIEFLELESQFQWEELKKKNYKPILDQNNNLFEPDHQSEKDQSNVVVSKENLDATKISYEKPVIPKKFHKTMGRDYT